MPLLERILKFILYGLLLTPLLVWGIFLFPFITTKVLYFRLLVEVALVLYLPLALRRPELRPSFNLVSVSVLVYFAVVFVTSLFGVDFYHSFWGTIERGEGLVTLAHFVLFFIMLTSVFRREADWTRYLRLTLVSTLLVGLYAFAQLLGFQSILSSGAGARVSGTIGNAAFFAAVEMFGMFLALFLVRRTADSRERIFYYAAFVFELVMIYKSETRGAILATVLALFIYLLVSIFQGRSRRVKLAAAAAAAIVVLSGALLYWNRESAFVKNSSTLLRFASISGSDTTTQSRLDTWRASWQGWRDRLLTGYGYENYNIAFNKYFPARIFKKPGSQIWFDRAHNIFFDVAVTSGLLGLFAYVGIYLAAFFVLYRSRRKNNLFLALALGAYVIHNLFVFDTQTTHLLFFILLAYIAFLRKKQREPAPAGRPVRHVGMGSAAFLVLLGMVAYFVNIRPALANYHAVEGIKIVRGGGKLSFVPDEVESALSFGTYMDPEIRQHLTDAALAANDSDLYGELAEELRKNIRRFPLDVKNYLYLMDLLNHTLNAPGAAQEVLSLGDQAIRLSPTRPQIYEQLGQTLFYKKEFAAGLQNFRYALALSPEPMISHFNYMLAAIVAREEAVAESERQVITTAYRHAFDADEHIQIAQAYVQSGNQVEAIKQLRQAIALEPKRTDLRANLTVLLAARCDLDAVRFELNEILSRDPGFTSQTMSYLAQVEKTCKK